MQLERLDSIEDGTGGTETALMDVQHIWSPLGRDLLCLFSSADVWTSMSHTLSAVALQNRLEQPGADSSAVSQP